MRVLTLLVLAYLAIVSCNNDTAKLKTAQTKYPPSPMEKSVASFMTQIQSTEQVIRMPFIYDPINTYAFDGDSLSLDSLGKLHEREEIAAIFSLTTYREFTKLKLTDSKEYIEVSDSTDVHKDSLAFLVENDRLILAYSHEHVRDNELEPVHLDLFYNHNCNLFLSLGTQEVGPMDAVVYNTKTGDGVRGFSEMNYEGSYHIGILTSLDSIEFLSLALLVEDKIYFRDYKVEDIMKDGS